MDDISESGSSVSVSCNNRALCRNYLRLVASSGLYCSCGIVVSVLRVDFAEKKTRVCWTKLVALGTGIK